MEARNAVVLKPISVLKPEPKKHSPFLKISKPQFQFHGTGLVLISSVFNSAFAKALTYEEALNQSTTASESSSFKPPDFDVTGIIDFAVENPLVVAGGAAVLALPAILSQVFGKSSKPWGVETAKTAFEKLGDDGNAQLLDIRANSDIRAVGSPDIKDLKKKPVTVTYNGDDKQGFLKKLSLKFKEPENTTLFILDKFDGSSELVAELVTVNGFKAAYAIKDGAEGSRGWMNSGLPWILPKKSFTFDLSSLNDAVDGILGDGSEAIALLFGIAAATGLSLLAFTEVETILEVLGSAALVQLVSKKLLFAEDRKKTFKEVGEFVSAQIGPKELLDDIKDIGKALLPPVTSKTLPASTTAVVELTNSSPPPAEVQEQAATPVEPPPQVNAVPKIEVKEEALPKPSRPLSPYPYYPNLKPPSSPTPSKP
ncbi:hypothetical protein L1987_73071 [Smallanthus sonchifolius]|uniref:Uncharacterized protein n=1 Tax=Smallanthus sonchifolius TaxID=185202 RepID=A0ACB9A021_9ASTR|nr:hypothetical protein L1987_73071 [Smallanthus sonchifolius]